MPNRTTNKANRTPRRKLMLLATFSVSVALIQACSVFAAYDVITRQNTPWRQLESQAELLALNCAAAVQFSASVQADRLLTKPIDPMDMLPGVRNLLALRAHQDFLERSSDLLEAEVQRRTAALIRAEQNIIGCLARAAEYRDNDTGRHAIRVGRYAALIAEARGFDESYAQLIQDAAKLHDVGKIGIPDSILLKTGKLDPDECALMHKHCGMGIHVLQQCNDTDFRAFRRHVQMGSSILNEADSPLLVLAARIALTHHEKWDGSGYPFGLAGEQIPLEGRITAVADVFDALSTRRPYKPPFPLERCIAILNDGRGQHFDPQVLDAFLSRQSAVVAIQMRYSELE